MENESKSPAGEELPAIREVSLSREPVELYKILKFEGMLSSGGEAKAAVAAGQVLVNGKVETQKRKKIMSGDIIEFGGDKIRVQLSTSGSEDEEVEVQVQVELELELEVELDGIDENREITAASIGSENA